MANDCSNRLQIYCDNKHMLEDIHKLFYRDVSGETRYTMMKLVPIPADKYDSEGYPLVGFFTPIGYWGTRKDYDMLEVKHYEEKITFKYWTANGPNDYWIHELICSIMEMLDEFSIETKPTIYIKHLFDVCQVLTAGYMYWEPGMEMKYEYSTDDIPNETVEYEFKAVEEEKRIEMEVFEFHLEDYLEEEPIEDDCIDFTHSRENLTQLIAMDEIYNEMRKESQQWTRSSDPSFQWFGNYVLQGINDMESSFEPYEILAILPHSLFYYFTKDFERFGEKLVGSLAANDLKQFKINDVDVFLEKVRIIPDGRHTSFARILCELETPHRFYSHFFPDNQIPIATQYQPE
ncbi:MAG: hypothetical protein U9R43_18405 [Thermodesulfobacteriota bacterium]|nr:hypothetical protein [Thermodesulfobacteriota bacterium]